MMMTEENHEPLTKEEAVQTEPSEAAPEGPTAQAEEVPEGPSAPSEKPAPAFTKEEPLVTFAADLTKEEFIFFYTTANSTPQKEKQRKLVSVASTLLVIGMCVFFLISDWQTTQTVDPMTVGLLLFSVAMGIFSLFGMPRMMRRRAEREYDKAAQIGHSYNGIVRVFTNRVEKETADSVTTLPLNDSATFMEREDVMVLSVPNKPILLLFPRYLNKEEADVFKQQVLAALPERNCRLLSRFIPKKETDVPLPVFEEKAEPTELLTLRFCFTDAEVEAIFRDELYRRFSKTAPLFGGMILVAAVLMWLLSENVFVGAGTLVVMGILTWVLMLWRPLRKAAAVSKEMSSTARMAMVTFTDAGIANSIGGSEKQFVPWRDITRAVNSPDAITLYVDKSVLTIPKRVIEQEEEFCRMVDNYMQTQEDPRGES